MKFARRPYVVLGILARATLALRTHRGTNTTSGKTSNYKLEMSNFNNVQYSSPLTLGTQTIPVIYDTGSFEILVLSTLCDQCSRDHTLYDSQSSESFSPGGITAQHFFGSGSVTSQQGFETVRIGDQFSSYVAQQMAFWQVVNHQIDVWDRYTHFSGIVGMGHPSYIPEGFSGAGGSPETLLSTMGVDGFAVCLERWGDSAPGWFIFGPTVSSWPSSQGFQSLRVVGDVHWAVRMTDVYIEGQDVGDPCSTGCGAIIDSGTSLISAPPSAQAVVARLSRLVKQDCSNIHTLPTLRMKLDGVDIELPPRAYVIQNKRSVGGNSSAWDWLYPGSQYSHDSECFAAFMSIDKTSQVGPVWILGMPFLRYYYTVFDRSYKKIHIAEASLDCEVESGGNSSWWNMSAGVMMNRTHARGALDHHHRHFANDDYFPLRVDLDHARVPNPALKLGGNRV